MYGLHATGELYLILHLSRWEIFQRSIPWRKAEIAVFDRRGVLLAPNVLENLDVVPTVCIRVSKS